MAKMEESTLAEDDLSESVEENAVNGRESSQQSNEEATLFVQKNVNNRQNCNIENLQVLGVDLLSKIQNLEKAFSRVFTESRICEFSNIDMSKVVGELYGQVQLCIAELKQVCTLCSFPNPLRPCGCDDLGVRESLGLISHKQQASYPYQEDSDLGKELSAKIFELEKLKSDNWHKEEELEALRYRQNELETQISSLEKEKSQLEENMEIMRREVVVTAKFLDDLRSEMMDLDSNMNPQISANKILVKKSSELENGKQEVEIHLCELEEETLILSEQLCGLEEKLGHLTDERESWDMELQTPQSEAMGFKDETLREVDDEMEEQKVDRSEVQEEYEYLKAKNHKLIEECNMLQKANAELRKQKMELQERCLILEAESKESEKVFSNILNKVDNLQRENQLLEEEISAQLQKKLLLQDEVLTLKETISEAKFENEMLEATFVMLSRDYEELKAETSLFVQNIFNSCSCGKLGLDEALGTQEALMKNGLDHLQVDDNQNCDTESSQFMGMELAEAVESNDIYKAQLKSLLSKETSIHFDVPDKSTSEGDVAKDRYECKVSTLEIEMTARYQIC